MSRRWRYRRLRRWFFGRGRGPSPAAIAVLVGLALAIVGHHPGHRAHHGGQGGGVPAAVPAGPVSSGSNVALGEQLAAARGWTGGQWDCLDWLWTRESDWNTYA